ncbi:MAG: hypothetical protein U9R01_01320, partial [candidate division WOR-3 bacterium]|nr:hypothetical protein [candidate division WOR-3 bacterium]
FRSFLVIFLCLAINPPLNLTTENTEGENAKIKYQDDIPKIQKGHACLPQAGISLIKNISICENLCNLWL